MQADSILWPDASMRRLCAGVLSQSQVLLAFGVVAELFNGVRDSPAEPMDGGGPLPQSRPLQFDIK